MGISSVHQFSKTGYPYFVTFCHLGVCGPCEDGESAGRSMLGPNIYGYDTACDWLARLHMSDVKPTMTKASSQPEPARRFFSIPPVVSSTSLRKSLQGRNLAKKGTSK